MRYKAIDIGLDEHVVITTFAHLEFEEIQLMFTKALADEDYELCGELQAEATGRGYTLSNRQTTES